MSEYDPKKKRPKREEIDSVVDDIFGEDNRDIDREDTDKKDFDNVLPLYPEAQDTPLVMQPQVWVATGVALLAFLFYIKRRKRRN